MPLTYKKNKFLMKNGIIIITVLCTGSHKSFPILGGENVKRIFKYLYYNNYIDIDIRNSGIHKLFLN